ncbi:MAG: hypothetical protein A2Z14_08325 [Chloroflexi bacterium RBG_16_48_8]|nr:MAG: hypothetical protein A2Z14_08325 [Chloroflexi bacterium RBG_16_48_8]
MIIPIADVTTGDNFHTWINDQRDTGFQVEVASEIPASVVAFIEDNIASPLTSGGIDGSLYSRLIIGYAIPNCTMVANIEIGCFGWQQKQKGDCDDTK